MDREGPAAGYGDIAAVNAAGIVQGLALVTFPAASAVFTSPHYYGLSSTAYGGMFVPQAIMAVAASLLGAELSGRLGIKRVYLLGLSADLLSMVVLVASRLAMGHGSAAYLMLLLATTSLGIGFGLTVPALNTFTAAFFPRRIDSAVLVLNALLGLGTALAPILVAVFVHAGIWWGLPLLVAVLLLGLFVVSVRLPLGAGITGGSHGRRASRGPVPRRFWIFAGFALLYGVLETMSGNWATLYMSRSVGASALAASLALAAFWGMVTAGRILFAGIARWLPEQRTYQLLPVVVAVAFGVIALSPAAGSLPGILAFGLAGLGCSALLPLTISFGQGELTTMTATVAGGLIAFYQVGYGIAAFGVGPLQERAGLSLDAVFALAALVALVATAVAFALTRPTSPSSLYREKENTV
jgi:MFS family permease